MTTACEVICAQNKVRYKSQAQSCRVASCTSVRIIPLHGLCASVPSGLNREAPLTCAGPEGVLTQLRNAVLCVLEVARPSAVPPPSAKAARKYSCAGRLGRARMCTWNRTGTLRTILNPTSSLWRCRRSSTLPRRYCALCLLRCPSFPNFYQFRHNLRQLNRRFR